MAKDTKVDYAAELRKVDLLEELSDKQLKNVAKMTQLVVHEAGQEVASEGKNGVGFHLLIDGTAVVEVAGKKRRDLKPGDYFGEISLIDGKPRSATVRATSRLTTLALTAWEFRPLLKEQPVVAQALLVKLCDLVRGAEGREAS